MEEKSYGRSQELQAQTTGTPDGLLDSVRLVFDGSGGSVTAAQFGLCGAGGPERLPRALFAHE
jgi:hypothetical protein